MAFENAAPSHGANWGDLHFLDGDSLVATVLRDRDWSDHPLGPPQFWPAALKLSISLCLRAHFPTAVYWGPSFWLIYNDAWIATVNNHPEPLAQPAERARGDRWPILEPHFRRVFETGKGVTFAAQPWTVMRNGVPTPSYWSYTIAPIQDETGAICGLFNQGLDVTEQVETERDLRAAKQQREFILTLVERQRIQPDPDDVLQCSVEALGAFLKVDRAGFFEILPGQILKYGACWVSPRLPALVGAVSLELFGKRFGTDLEFGTVLVFNSPDDPVAPPRAVLDAFGSKAGLSVPLIRGGKFQGALYLSQVDARIWTRCEIALVEEVAELTWDAVARVRAVSELRALNNHLTGKVAAQAVEREQFWESIPILLGVATLDGCWLSLNPAWERLLGWSSDELIGRDSAWLQHPDDHADSVLKILCAIASGAPQRRDTRLRTRAGDYRTLIWQCHIVGDRLYASARDVTDELRETASPPRK